MNAKTLGAFFVAAFACVTLQSHAADSAPAPAADELSQGFVQPPAHTRPWCYWYWISDNLSKEGITKDLEAMARVGIGEALIGNVVDPDTPMGNVPLRSDTWFDCMAHAVAEGKRVGVDIGSFNGPGWSQSGGPWVTSTQAMRYVVSSEIRVKGPAKFEGKLAVPREPFQNIAVLAFPAPQGERDNVALRPKDVRCTPEVASPERLIDGDPTSVCAFPAEAHSAGKRFTVELEFAEPFTARSVSIYPETGSFLAKCELFAADEKGEFRLVSEFVMDRRGLSRPKYAVNVGPMPRGPVIASFKATRARKFRLKTTLQAVEGMTARVVGSAEAVPGAPGLGEIVLSGAARVDRVIEKQLGKMYGGTQPEWDAYLWPKPVEPETSGFVVPAERIVNLTGLMDSEGVLRWDVPEGEWVIQRIGMTPTGAENHPTTDQGRGPECDKMNRAAIEAHFNGFMSRILERTPEEARAALKHVIIDSYEVGSQNWTDGFQETFQKAFGYDPRPWLPVLSGRIVESADESDRFLWDLRRHVADRIATEYVGGLRDIGHRHGLRLWLENYGHWGFPAEFLQYGGQSDDLGGEFWVREGSPLSRPGTELRAASSAAHIYGKRQVYAEAFTSGRSFRDAPGNIKALGDWVFCQGINHFVFHVYIHQPWEERKPGVNAWFGTEFNRHNTWFEQSKAFVDYVRRCQFMLQRGTSTAEVAYFIGEDTPKMTGIREPELPAGYDFDYINAEALLSRTRVVNGRLALPDGPSYVVLVLPPLETMRPEVLRRIRDLVSEGACVLGKPPRRSPSLQNYPEADREVERLAREIWGRMPKGKRQSPVQRTFGKGRIFVSDDLAGALREIGAEPVLLAPEQIAWTHRKDVGTDIFFLSNQKNEPVLTDVSFRTTGKTPEFWHPDTGKQETTAWFEVKEGRTYVPVALDAQGSVFVVFRHGKGPSVTSILKEGAPVKAVNGQSSPVRVKGNVADKVSVLASETGRYTLTRRDGRTTTLDIALPPALELATPWKLSFGKVHGAPGPVELTRLMSWSEHPSDRIKYFSGTASYKTTLTIPRETLTPGRRLTLDLGTVEVMATVRVNGRSVGTLWKKPFTVDITETVHAGANELEVDVTNLWWNRLVGEQKLPQEQRTTFTTAKLRQSKGELLPSGLLGPVKVSFSEEKMADWEK